MRKFFFFTFDATTGLGAVRTATTVVTYKAATVTEAWSEACRDGFFLLPGAELKVTGANRWTAKVGLA